MKKEHEDLIAVDIGNSRIKVLHSEGINKFEIEPMSIINIKNFFKNFENKNIRIGISSVNNKAKLKLTELLNKLNLNYVDCNSLLDVQNSIDFTLVTGMGNDRKLGLLGALVSTKPPVITVDIGTAITINLLDERKRCLGGVIFPGPYTQMKSLATEASALDLVELSVAANISATDTKTAIGNGVIYGVCGAIKEIIEMVKLQVPEFKNSKIIITGGGSELVRKILMALGYKFLFIEDLVPKGIIELMVQVKKF